MQILKRTFLHFTCLAGLTSMLAAALPAQAQGPSGEIRGTVTDPTGALIPSAQVVLTGPGGSSKSVTGGRDGNFQIAPVQPGSYTLVISATGFAATTLENIEVMAGKTVQEKITLQLPVEEQQVQVKEDTPGVSTSPDDNASSIVIKGKDLDALSDDPDELQSELTALAGPAAGPNGAQIFIDGFTGGQLPPKSSIREIRINQNPFSAQYDKLGYGRIEILTKPGTDKFHGSVFADGNTTDFNTRNPFATNIPPYHSEQFEGNIGGPITKKSSFYFDG